MSENAKKTTLRQRLLELFRPADEDRQELHYHGRPMTRLIGYLKPHRKVFFLCLALVLLLTGLELIRPMIIGNAIDRYITGETSPEVLAAAGNTGRRGNRRMPALRGCCGRRGCTWPRWC